MCIECSTNSISFFFLMGQLANRPAENTRARKNNPSPWQMRKKRTTTDKPTDRTSLESILYYSTWNLYPHLLDPFLFLLFRLVLVFRFLVEKAKRPPLATSILFITFLFISSALEVHTPSPPPLSSVRLSWMRDMYLEMSVRAFLCLFATRGRERENTYFNSLFSFSQSFIHSFTHLILVILLNLIFKSYWLEYLKCDPRNRRLVWNKISWHDLE